MIRSKWMLFIGFGLCLIAALATLRVIPLGLHAGFQDMLPHINIRPIAFLTHISASSVALAIGGFQLWDGLRKRHLNWHRWAGCVYVLAVLFGGASGFWLGLTALGGPIAQVGFTLLAALWLVITSVAVVHILSGNVQAHRAWMYRSFALTFAAVTLRLQLLVFTLLGFKYVEASIWLAWISWVPNIIWIEWKIHRE